jgi:hypothetical protein
VTAADGGSGVRIELEPYGGGGIGNYLFHLCHAVMYAQIRRARLVVPPPGGFRSMNTETVTLDFADSAGDAGEPAIRLGSFIHGNEATRQFSFRYRYHCMQDHVAPLFDASWPRAEVSDRLLVIHVRSGDIFEPGGSNAKYGQPPLSWYLRLLEDPDVAEVLVVTETRPSHGRVNPVVERLVAADPRVRVQSESREFDFHTLRHARQLALSVGTFALAAAMTNTRLARLHVPEYPRPADPNFSGVFPRGCDYGFDLRTWEVRGYENLSRWENRPDQIRTMLRHPARDVVPVRD